MAPYVLDLSCVFYDIPTVGRETALFPETAIYHSTKRTSHKMDLLMGMGRFTPRLIWLHQATPNPSRRRLAGAVAATPAQAETPMVEISVTTDLCKTFICNAKLKRVSAYKDKLASSYSGHTCILVGKSCWRIDALTKTLFIYRSRPKSTLWVSLAFILRQ